MDQFVDLRSDTVTRPTPGMREAMARAEVGDDVLGDDPTVIDLERRAAELMGEEAALFMPSGTMSNTVAICSQTHPGDEVLMDWDAHSMRYEVGAPAVVAGVITRQFRSFRGTPDVADIAAAIQAPSLHSPGTALVVLENTHNVSGGTVIPLEVHEAIWRLTRERGGALHIDGARIFNASVASGVPVREYAGRCDTITFCLSKGLGCPAGSVLCGTAETISRARRVRKMLGGGMRQAGVLAAAGLYALENHVARLADDHRRARLLAETLAELPGVSVEQETVQTNMVYFETKASASEWVQRLREEGVLCLALGENRIRLVTHLDVDDEAIQRACTALRRVAESMRH